MKKLLLVVVLSMLTVSNAFAKDSLKVVVFGDSLVSGHGIDVNFAFPAVLERYVNERGYDAEVVNAGISGDTTRAGLARVQSIIDMKPHMVILELGINDVFRKRPVQEIYENLQRIINRLKQHNIRVLLVGMRAPPSYGPQYVGKFSGMYKYLAYQNNLDFYPFFVDGIVGNPEYNNADGIHPNPKGVEIIARNILPYVEKMLYEISFDRVNKDYGSEAAPFEPSALSE